LVLCVGISFIYTALSCSSDYFLGYTYT